MKMLSAVGLLLVLAGPALAQGGGRQLTPPPDHWMTFDSLAAAVGLTDAQKPEVLKHYDAINAVLKQASEKRAQFRSQRMGGGPPSQEAMQAMRAEMEKLQGDLEAHYAELRKLLTPDQQGKLDALGKPAVMMMRRPPRTGLP